MKSNKHMCGTLPSLSMYIDVRGSLDWVCLLRGVRMWAFRDLSFFVFIFVVCFESEMSDFLLGALGHCPFHHYIHCWCDFPLCLIWVDHHSFSYVHCFTIILIIAFHLSSSFHPLFFSYSDPSRVWYSLCIIITHLIINLICFICLLIDIIFTLGTRKSMTHEIYYTCCILYMRAWVSESLGIWA